MEAGLFAIRARAPGRADSIEDISANSCFQYRFGLRNGVSFVAMQVRHVADLNV
jgi:hypothetical protein